MGASVVRYQPVPRPAKKLIWCDANQLLSFSKAKKIGGENLYFRRNLLHNWFFPKLPVRSEGLGRKARNPVNPGKRTFIYIYIYAGKPPDWTGYNPGATIILAWY